MIALLGDRGEEGRMYCPNCGTEYREGVTRCAECDVALVSALPDQPAEPEATWQDLETVLVTGDASLIPVVRSLLEAEGIACFAQGEMLQDYLGIGRIGLGSNLVTGDIQLQVRPEDAEQARALLKASDIPVVETPDPS